MENIDSPCSSRLQESKQEIDESATTSKSEYASVYRSADFCPGDLEECLQSPISVIRNLECAINLMNIKDTSTENQEKYVTETKNIIHLKNNIITNLHYFVHNFTNTIQSVFSKIDAIVYKRTTCLLDKNKYFIRFFREITTLYETFSINLIQANNTINLHFQAEDENGPFTDINTTIDKTQETISNNIYDFSKNLHNKIFSKGPLTNVKELYNKMTIISKESSSIMQEITKKRDKLMHKFMINEKIFESFKKCYNDNEKVISLLNKNDFFLIEFTFCTSVNKLFLKISHYLHNYKKCFNNLKLLVEELIIYLKHAVGMYIEESKKMFSIADADNMLINLSNQINNIDFSIFPVMSNSNKEINDLLKIYQANLLKSTFVKDDNIYNDSFFSVSHYNKLEELIDFMITVLPHKIDIENSKLLLFACQVTKISGVFRNDKKCVLALTVQNNLYIFNDKINNKNYDKLSLKNIKFRNANDKSHPYRFEISELKVGMIYNSTNKVILEAEDQHAYNQIESSLGIYLN